MWYDPVGSGLIRDRIEIDDEAHKAIVDKLEGLVAEINETLHKAFEAGDIVRAQGGISNRSDGPALTFDITSVTNGFWKKGK